jgi:hypothetical protein
VAIFWWVSALGVLSFGIFELFSVGGRIGWKDRFKRFGLGTIDPATSIINSGSSYTGSPSTFPLQVIIANCPQLWLSIGYLLWNNQLSRIYMEREWRQFYHQRIRPRVSYPLIRKEPGLRSTRWLQLPYGISIILMIVNTILHWLVSQTLFVVEILPTATKPANFYLNFSPFAIVCVGGASTLLVLGITIFYFIRFKTWMPLMAGSLRIVLESCRYLPTPKDLDGRITLPKDGIMWGDISTQTERRAGFDADASPLVTGAIYPDNRELEAIHIRRLPVRDRGSISTFDQDEYYDKDPLMGRRRYQ